MVFFIYSFSLIPSVCYVGFSLWDDCPFKSPFPGAQVSWVRHRDVHILTAGEQTFTTDQRFSAKHNTDDEWVLVIKFVQVK